MTIYFERKCIDGSVTKYVYSAAGEKLRVTHLTAVPNISVAIGSTRELLPSEILSADSVDYLLGGSLTMRNGRIDKYLFDEGYCQAKKYVRVPSQDNFTFYYYNRDHLGSIRQVIKADGSQGSIVQSMNYYPFGAQFCDGSTDNNFQSRRYNGKEFDNMHGLNTYDYGARQYNPVTARWDRVDPLCEKYYSVSPYGYCGDNPVNAVDADGMKFEWVTSTHSDEIYSKVQALRMKSEVFNVLYSYLDNLIDIYYIHINDEDVQRSIRAESGNPNARAGGYFNGVNKIVFSEIDADTGTFTEELFHVFQNKQYGNTRETWELDAEAKILNNIVSIETEVDGKGINKILQAIETKGGLPTFFYDFKLQNNLSIPRYSEIEKSYFNEYLTDFSNYNDNEGNVYRGKQRQLPPNAYNYIISLAF